MKVEEIESSDVKRKEKLCALIFTKREAALLIAHLAAQLGDTPLPNSSAGAVYDILTSDNNQRKRYLFSIEPNPNG